MSVEMMAYDVESKGETAHKRFNSAMRFSKGTARKYLVNGEISMKVGKGRSGGS